MPAILLTIASWLGKTVAVGLGLKLAFSTFMIFVFPLILKKFFFEFILDKINAAVSVMNDGSTLGAIVVDMTGLAGYLAQQTRLDDCIPILISAIITSFLLKVTVK